MSSQQQAAAQNQQLQQAQQTATVIQQAQYVDASGQPAQYSYSYAAPPSVPANVQIDEKIVLKQKEKALRELESRQKLALAQHDQMYTIQRNHIIAEHDRQLQLARSAIEAEKANALMALEQSYQSNSRGIDHAAQAQKIQIEQQANLQEIHAIQHQMMLEHAQRERQWTGGNAPAAVPQPQFYQTSVLPAQVQYAAQPQYVQGQTITYTQQGQTITQAQQ